MRKSLDDRRRELEKEFEALVPGLKANMYLVDALQLILDEFKRLKKLECQYDPH